MNRRTAAVLTLTLTTVSALSGCVVKEAKEGVTEIKKTNATQCAEERDLVSKAVESFTLLEGHVPTEAEMVPNYLRVQSVYFDVDAQGNVVPAPGGGCT